MVLSQLFVFRQWIKFMVLSHLFSDSGLSLWVCPTCLFSDSGLSLWVCPTCLVSSDEADDSVPHVCFQAVKLIVLTHLCFQAVKLIVLTHLFVFEQGKWWYCAPRVCFQAQGGTGFLQRVRRLVYDIFSTLVVRVHVQSARMTGRRSGWHGGSLSGHVES